MKHPAPSVLAFAFVLLAACSAQPSMPTTTGGPLRIVPDQPANGAPAAQEPAAKPAAGGESRPAEDAAAKAKADAEAKQKEAADRQKELRQKERELGYARREGEAAAIDRRTRAATVQFALEKAKFALAQAKEELELFQKVRRPNQLEEQRIQHQQHVYSAEHAKDELQELEDMYKAEEFAKATKELVLKRGRRQLELAERNLAVSTTELKLLEEHTLPQRQEELQRKVAEAELELTKAQLEVQKAEIELELAAARAGDKVEDLQGEIEELKRKVEADAAASGGEGAAGAAKEAR